MKKSISAFAYRTGRKIEELIQKEMDKMQSRNLILEENIMAWYMKTKDEEFAKHFGISKDNGGGSTI